MIRSPRRSWAVMSWITVGVGLGAFSVLGLSPLGHEHVRCVTCTPDSLAQAIEGHDESVFALPPWEELSLELSVPEEALRRILVWDDESLVAQESELTSALTAARVIVVADTHDRPHAVNLVFDTIQRIRRERSGGRRPGTIALALESLPTTLAEELESVPLLERAGHMKSCLRGCWAWKCDPYDKLLDLSVTQDVQWIGLGPILHPLPVLEHLSDSSRPFPGAVTSSQMEQNILAVDRSLNALVDHQSDRGSSGSQVVVLCGAAHVFRSEGVLAACASGTACLLVCGFPEWEWAATRRVGNTSWSRALRPFKGVFRVPPVGGVDELCEFYRRGAGLPKPVATTRDEAVRLCVHRLSEAEAGPAIELACLPLREGTVSADAMRSALADASLTARQLVALIWAVRLDSWTTPAAELLFEAIVRDAAPVVRSNLLARWGGLGVLPTRVRRECVGVLTGGVLEDRAVREAAAISLGRHLLHAELVIPILLDDIVAKGPSSVVRNSLGLLARFGARARPWLAKLRSCEGSISQDLLPSYHEAIALIETDML